MSVIISKELPAVEELRAENIATIASEEYADKYDNALKIGLLNLMPLKPMTETDFIRLLAGSALDLELELINVGSHVSKNTPREHIERFYRNFDEIREKEYDGFIITGAPVEKIDFEEVDYWPELTEIFDWTRRNSRSTLYICWGALAGLYHHYGVPKHVFAPKISGVFKHTANEKGNAIFRGFDDEFYVPHSRYSEVRRQDIEQAEGLKIMSESPESGVYMVMGLEGREWFVTGHSEYAPGTLDFEYRRDCKKGLSPAIPANYYRDNNPDNEPVVKWRSHANLLFSNWINYFVNPNSAYAKSR